MTVFPPGDYYLLFRAGALRNLFYNLDKQRRDGDIISAIGLGESDSANVQARRDVIPCLKRLSSQEWSYEESIHLVILRAAGTTGQLPRIAEMYKAIWQDMTPEHQDRSVMRYSYATALLYGGVDEFLAFSIFKDLALRTSTAAYDWMPRKAYKNIYRLVSDLANSSDPAVTLRSTVMEYMDKLTVRVSSSKRDFMTGGRDPRLALVRYSRFDDDDSKSRSIIRNIFADVLETEPDVSDGTTLDDRLWTFAIGLTVIGDDQSAIAAWRALGCMPPAPDNVELDCSEKCQPEIYITVRCDGCGNRQRMMDLQHWCRDCLGLALCDECWSQRCQIGGSNPIVCGNDHAFLYVPRLDDDQFQTLRSGEMVDETGSIVPRRIWIERLREAWNLRQEQVEAKKTMEITELHAGVTIVRCLTAWWLRIQKSRGLHGQGLAVSEPAV